MVGSSAGKKRSVQHGHLHFSSMIRHRDGKEAGVLVIHVDEINAVIRRKWSKPQTPPVKQVFRDGPGDARPNRHEELPDQPGREHAAQAGADQE